MTKQVIYTRSKQYIQKSDYRLKSKTLTPEYPISTAARNPLVRFAADLGPSTGFRSLALDVAGSVAAAGGLSTGDADTGPGPVGASTLTAEDVDVLTLGRDGTLDVLDLQVGDGEA